MRRRFWQVPGLHDDEEHHKHRPVTWIELFLDLFVVIAVAKLAHPLHEAHGWADVAAFLQVSRSWVYQKAEAGLLPVIRLPGSGLLRFEPDTIRAFALGEWKPVGISPVHAAQDRSKNRK